MSADSRFPHNALPSVRRGSRAAVLVGTVIMLLTISLIGATLASFFFSVTSVAETELARAQALYLAESGIAQAIHQLRQAGRFGGAAPPEIPSTTLGDGEYEVSHDLTTGLITATGRVGDVRRTIQIKYYPF